MSLCAICGSGSRCLTHDSNREAIDIGRPARVVGPTFDAALGSLNEPALDGDGRPVETVELDGVSR